MCVSFGSKAIAEISSLESLLVLCVGLSLYVCVCLSHRDLRRSSNLENTGFMRSLRCGQHGFKKPGDFTVSKGHGYPLVYNILGVCPSGGGHPSIPSSIHPSSSSRKKKMMEEEEDEDEWQQQQFIQMFM